MGFRRSAATFFFGLIATACVSPPPQVPTIVAVEETKRAPNVEDDGRTLVDDLAAAERLYEEQHDPSAILAYFAPDVTVTAGRGEKPGPTDTLMDFKTFSAVYIWASKFDTKMQFRYESPELSVRGENATMQWTTFHDAGGPEQTWSFIQHYEFQRRGKRWMIVRYRYWPIRPEDGQEYDFEALDEQVETARAANDERNLARNLMLAYRFRESAEMSKKITLTDPNDAWNWDMRAKASAMVGDLTDAESASNVAKALRADSTEH